MGEGRRRIVATQDIDLAIRTSGDPFPAFDPHKDIGIGLFVAMCSLEHERKNGKVFYVGKVCTFNCVANTKGMMQVICYWLKMWCGSIDAPGEWHQRYSSCRHRAWIPSREPNDWISAGSAMTLW